MIITINTTTEMLVGQLKRDDIKVGQVSPLSEVEDASIELTPTLHIQMGQAYVCLVRENPDGTFQWLYNGNVYKALLTAIRRELNNDGGQ